MLPNLLGTEFRQLDHRVDPRDSGQMEYAKGKGKNELSAVVYEPNVMGRWGRGRGGGGLRWRCRFGCLLLTGVQGIRYFPLQ